MSKKEKISIVYVNKKGIKKSVTFYMDKKTIKVLNNKTINTKYKLEYQIEEYHFIERERKYRKRYIHNDNYIYNCLCSNEKTKLDNLVYIEKVNKIIDAIKGLSLKQQMIIKKILLDGKKQVEVAKELKISKSSVNITYKRAIKNLKKIINK